MLRSPSHQNSLHLFIILPLFFVEFHSLSKAGSTDYFSDCTPFDHHCGNQTYRISYPFLLNDSISNACGHPGFNVSCDEDDTGLLATIRGKDYRINSIDYDNHEIHITDANFVEGASSSTCSSHSFTNSTIDSLLFNDSKSFNLAVYLNCSPKWDSVPENLYNISCLSTDGESGNKSYYSFPAFPLPPRALSACSSVVYVPLNETAVEDLARVGTGRLFPLLKEGFELSWKVGGVWCDECEASNGVCGFNRSAPGAKTCYCSNTSSVDDGVCRPTPSGAGGGHKRIIIGTVGGLASFLLLFVTSAIYFARSRKSRNSVIFCGKNSSSNQNIEAFLEEYGPLSLKRYSYSHVKKITKSFHEKLGQGGCGTVYKGTLSNGHMVAVKILNNSQGNGDDFINEVASIGRTYHVNIVSLLGFCSEGSKRALIYDYMCNGSLEKFLNLNRSKTAADWEKLYQIAVGIARGLEYLHSGCKTRIVHFDIKPHNILLDEDFCPKISDFGLAKLCLNKESIISIAGMRGTVGYIAPEVFSRIFGVVSSKSDVYSYGMMVLEMAQGRKNPNVGAESSSEMYFPHWIYEYLEQNRDLLTSAVTAESEETVRKMMLVGLWCIQAMPANRPSMSRVIEMLEGSVGDLQVPPKSYLSSASFGSLAATSSVQDVCSPAISFSVQP